MLSSVCHRETNNIITTLKVMKFSMSSFVKNVVNKTEFRVLEIIPNEKNLMKKKPNILKTYVPMFNIDISFSKNWQLHWPAAAIFQPYLVPFPVCQGYKNTKGIRPSKFANSELMKIPNFLHLTPPVVKKHCEALKKFCTKWPTELETDEACTTYFPVEIITSDYCYSSPTIREPLARIVSLKVKLSSLHLDAHAKDKINRLLGDKYNSQTDVITITADKCPVRKQNLDYVKYLLTALYHISWRIEPWEAEKSELDMEYYDWDKNKSREALSLIYSWPKTPTDFNCDYISHATEYKEAVTDLLNKGEEDQSLIKKYKQAVKNVLNLKYHENTE